MKVVWVSIGSSAGGTARYDSTLRGPLSAALAAKGGALTQFNVREPRVLVGLLNEAWSRFGLPSALGFRRVDVVHSSSDIAVPRVRQPLVVTSQDACALLRPDLVSPRLAALKKRSWRRSASWAALVVPSEATAADVEAVGVSPERIHVIRLALADSWRVPPSRTELDTARRITGDGPFAICVAPIARKKGSDVLLRAWREVTHQLPEARLVWVTGDRGAVERFAAETVPGQSAVDSILEVPSVDERTMIALVRNARTVVVASRYEGFSYPILEAMSQGTPVVATDLAPHREFRYEGLTLIPAADHRSLAESILDSLGVEQRWPPVADSRSADDVVGDLVRVYGTVV